MATKRRIPYEPEKTLSDWMYETQEAISDAKSTFAIMFSALERLLKEFKENGNKMGGIDKKGKGNNN